MLQLTIKEGRGMPCISLEIVDYYRDICKFKINVRVNYNGFTANAIVYNELMDFEMLNEALFRIKTEDNFYYEYKPMIDGNFSMSFTRVPTGNVNVKSLLYSEDCMCEMLVNFDIDQTFIQDICNQIKSIITYYHDK